MMQQYRYHGQSEKAFYMEFVHNVRCDFGRDPGDDSEVKEPYGVIMIPKEFATCWIAYRNYYLGWKVIRMPTADS